MKTKKFKAALVLASMVFIAADANAGPNEGVGAIIDLGSIRTCGVIYSDGAYLGGNATIKSNQGGQNLNVSCKTDDITLSSPQGAEPVILTNCTYSYFEGHRLITLRGGRSRDSV
ncbi:MAG: hypothetical protein ACXW1W_16150 [Methylococcaceae bacterium]